jgi:hypothetical protein
MKLLEQQKRRTRYAQLILEKISELVEGPGQLRAEFEKTPEAFTDFILALAVRVPASLTRDAHEDSIDFCHGIQRLLITEAIDLQVDKAIHEQPSAQQEQPVVPMTVLKDDEYEGRKEL